MPYLTEGHISYLESMRKRPEFPRGLVDSYAWHMAIWKTFPGKENDPRDFLSRIDRTDNGYKLIILSQTMPVRPEWWGLGKWRTTEITPAYFMHSSYAFQLKANATKTTSSTGMRSGIFCPVELRKWLDRKAAQSGFTVDSESLQVIPGGMDSFVRHGKRGFHSAADFRGILRVTNKDHFYRSVMRGIGRARGFGYGMLMVVPLTT